MTGTSRCWSCEGERGSGDALCPACGKVQPPPPAGTLIDNFAVLGVAQSFDVDPAALEEKFRALSRKLHPDRFARATPRERRYSLEQTTMLNNAFRRLKDPLLRAQDMLALHGVDASGEPGPGAKVPHEFLEEALHDRERLMEAKMDGGPAEVAKLGEEARSKRDAALQALAKNLREQRWPEAAQDVQRLRYHARFLEEVEGRERGFD